MNLLALMLSLVLKISNIIFFEEDTQDSLYSQENTKWYQSDFSFIFEFIIFKLNSSNWGASADLIFLILYVTVVIKTYWRWPEIENLIIILRNIICCKFIFLTLYEPYISESAKMPKKVSTYSKTLSSSVGKFGLKAKFYRTILVTWTNPLKYIWKLRFLICSLGLFSRICVSTIFNFW